MSRARAVLLVVLLALGGCAGLVPADGETDTATLTPVDVPEEQATDVRALLSGNPTRVVDKHVRRLARQPFLVTVSHTLTADEEVRHAYSARVAADGRYSASVATFTGPADRRNLTSRQVYDDGRWRYSYYQREVQGETVEERYDRGPSGNDTPFSFDRAGQLRTLFAGTEFNVSDELTAEGNYQLYVTDPFRVDTLETRVGRIESVAVDRLFVEVTPDGVVLRYRFTYRGTLDGREVAGAVRAQFLHVGTQTVEPPYWYDRAVANVSPGTPDGNDTATATSTAG